MVVEMVLMKLRTGVSEPAFLWAAEGTTAFLQACPGFIRRRLAKDAYGQWVDYLEWETMDAARQAAERFHSDPAMVVVGTLRSDRSFANLSVFSNHSFMPPGRFWAHMCERRTWYLPAASDFCMASTSPSGV